MFKEESLFLGLKRSNTQFSKSRTAAACSSIRHTQSSRRMLEVIEALVDEYCDWSNFAQFI